MSNLESSPQLAQAPILHVDLDAFFASVEILDDPSLRGRPVCVGGAGERGVIASASYEARRFGIYSAMPSLQALQRCPDLIILPGRFDRYESYSREFHKVIADVTPQLEPLGLDEVFADLSSLGRLDVRPLEAAHLIQRRLREELSLECGVGVARNKLFAKLGSKRAKPKISATGVTPGPGVLWVSPDVEKQWLDELRVEALWGVGPATTKKLHGMGLRWVRDLRSLDVSSLAHVVGPAMASTLITFSRGEDTRPVEVDRALKSLGFDKTYARSLRGREVEDALRHHAGVVARALRDKGSVARTFGVVVRWDDQTSQTRSQTLSFGLDDEAGIAAIALGLLNSFDRGRAVRLLGLHASSFLRAEENNVQLSFDGFDVDATSRSGAEATSRQLQITNDSLRDALDDIRRRFGADSVGVASEMTRDGVHVTRQRGDDAFGPSDQRAR